MQRHHQISKRVAPAIQAPYENRVDFPVARSFREHSSKVSQAEIARRLSPRCDAPWPALP